MATQGWEGYGFGDRPEVPRRKGRRSIAELLQAEVNGKLEKDLLAWVQELLRELQAAGKIRVKHHVPDTRRTRSEEEGFPDLTIGVRPGLILHLELKRPDGKGKLGPGQKDWLECAGDRGSLCSSQAEVLSFLRKWGIVP